MATWCHRKKGVYTSMLLHWGVTESIHMFDFSYVLCVIVTITVFEQSGCTVKEKDARIGRVSTCSSFSTSPPFAL